MEENKQNKNIKEKQPKNKKPQKPKKIHYWTNGLSVVESKVSVLIICLLAMIIFSIVMYIREGDISGTLASIISSLSLSIAGVNVADRIGGYFGTHQNYESYYDPYNTYNSQNNYNPYGNSYGNNNMDEDRLNDMLNDQDNTPGVG